MNSALTVPEFYEFWQPGTGVLFTCLPEILLGVLALLALVFDVACKSCCAKRAANAFVSAALIALFICLVGDAFPHSLDANLTSIFFPGAEIFVSQYITPLFVACAFFAIRLSGIVRSRESNAEISAPATTHLILIATAAASLLMKTANFIAFFVLLETLTVCLYALVGSNRGNAHSLEAGVKYLIAGGVSGGLMLFGIVLLYGGAALAGVPAFGYDPLGYATISVFLMQNPDSLLGLAGAGMVLAGVMFKLGVFPMQFWIPDVYQGAPTHVTFFLATLSKAVGLLLMFVMLFIFSGVAGTLIPVLLACALISIVYANLTALGQRNVKRLLGLSGVSHAGYLMLGVLATFSLLLEKEFSSAALSAVLVALYLVVYIVTVYPIFSVMVRMPQTDDALQNFDDYEKLAKRNPFLAGTLAFGLGSLAGIPPTVGFIAKLGILYALFLAGFYGSIAVMLACVVAGIYYYFGWLRAAFVRGECCGEKGGCGCCCEEKSCNASNYLPVKICSRIVLIVFCALLVLGSLGYWFVVRSFVSVFSF